MNELSVDPGPMCRKDTRRLWIKHGHTRTRKQSQGGLVHGLQVLGPQR
jgi:hypothetical protein